MSEYEVQVDGAVVEPLEGWRLEWIDQAHGVGRLTDGDESVGVLVEGRGADWFVTLAGRRIALTVRTWRERVLAAAETAARSQSGPVEVKATLPGLVVAVAVAEGDEVEEGSPLLTIEAMKMQNEVRAPRAGRVIEIGVRAGTTVATGVALLRLE